MRKLVIALALALTACGAGDGDCHTEIDTKAGTTVCLPDPAERKAICIQDPIDVAVCDMFSPCDGVLSLSVGSDGEGYTYGCLCETKAEADEWCTGKLVDAPRLD